MKKSYLLISLLIFLLVINKINSQVYLGTYHIIHKAGENVSEDKDKWEKETKQKETLYRNFSFDLKFADNCKYILPEPYQDEQLYKQKVVTLCTSQNNGSKNSLRVGWCYDPEIDKIRLAFYAHINHLEPGVGNTPGREVCYLNREINTNEWCYVKMAIGKKGMFMSIDGKSVIVSRDIYSWSEDGETTFVRASSYFEYGPCKPLVPDDCYGAVQDMDFYIGNAYINFVEFPWQDVICDYTADNIIFMNTNFAYVDQGPYQFFAGDSIYCTAKSSSTIEASLPYDPPFTVIEPGILVGFTASNSIILDRGFHAKPGSKFHAKIDLVQEPEQIIIQNEPVLLSQTICYNVTNTTKFNFWLYYYGDWVAGGTGYVNGNNACFVIDNFDELPNGHYQAKCQFSNPCVTLWREHEIWKMGTGTIGNKGKTSNVYSNIESSLKQTNIETLYDLPTDNNELSFSVFPNPCSGVFKIELINSLDLVSSIIIMNNLGNVILNKQELSASIIEINLTNHPRGIYFVKVQAGGQLFTEKIIYR